MRKLLSMSLIMITSWSMSQELKSFDFDIPSGQERRADSACKFEGLIPENVVVYAAGGSGRDAGFQIDDSGYSAKQFDVAVNNPDNPVILILGSHEPTIWNLGWSEGTYILAVLVSGHYEQVVAGLESNANILNSSGDNRGFCGYVYTGQRDNASLNSLNEMATKLFGKSLSMISPGDRNGKIMIGKPLSQDDKLFTSPENTPESFRLKGTLLAGPAGLEEAVEKGIIRRATQNDINRWNRGAPPNLPNRERISYTVSEYIMSDKAYVILKEFTYPIGLMGANSATFFIEKGVPIPKGDPGHSWVYDFNTYTCISTSCKH